MSAARRHLEGLPDAVGTARSSIRRATSPEEVLRALETAVEELGGVVTAPTEAGLGQLPVDLGMGVAEPRVPAGTDEVLVVVDTALPPLVEAARAALQRLRACAPPPVLSDPAAPAAGVAALADLLLVGDADGARELLASGRVEDRVGQLAAAQRLVGERWLRDELTVADEHRATAAAAELAAGGSRPRPGGAAGLAITLACPAGEAHRLTARLVAAVLTDRGHSVTLLPGPARNEQLTRALDGSAVELLALSCTTGLALAGAFDAVAVAHEHGVPVLLGGAALGTDGARARRMGADLWSDDAARVADHLLEAGPPAPTGRPTGDVGAAMAAALDRDETVSVAVGELLAASPPGSGATRELRSRVRQQVTHVHLHAEAALLTGDDAVLDDHLRWLNRYVVARALPLDLVPRLVDALARSSEVPELVALVRRCPVGAGPSPTAGA